jgi:hypothetical protein
VAEQLTDLQRLAREALHGATTTGVGSAAVPTESHGGGASGSGAGRSSDLSAASDFAQSSDEASGLHSAQGGTKLSTARSADEAEQTFDLHSAQAADLIDLYFAAETGTERDMVLDRLVALRSPEVEAFLTAVMEEDSDELCRAAATAALAAWQSPEALGRLEATLQAPDDLFALTFAIDTLAARRGTALYEPLVAIWRDRLRDPDERREALLGLERIDTPRALRDFEAFIDGLQDFQALPEGEVEAIMACFARHGYAGARPCLQRLRDKIAASPTLKVRERDDWLAWVSEGMAMLAPTAGSAAQASAP